MPPCHPSYRHSTPSRRLRIAWVIGFALPWICCSGIMANESPPPSSAALPHLVGQTLQGALKHFTERGLSLVYTDQLVPAHLKVEQQPLSPHLERALLELLSPHGLSAQRLAGDRWVVVVATPQPAHLTGHVFQRPQGNPLPGARLGLRIEQGSAPARVLFSRDDGSFAFGDLDADTYRLHIHLDGFLPDEHVVQLAPGERLSVQIELREIPVSSGEIEVTTEPPGLLGAGLSSLTLVQDELQALPHLGDQALRGLIHLPGTSGSDLSAQLNVRGGRTDEVMVQLDGLEIFEAYHLPDFGNAFSVFASETVQQVDLLTGGFPVEYGDRMAGILDISTIEPRWRRQSHLGFSVYQLRAGHSGTSASGHMTHLSSLRIGSLELPLRLADEEENPSFADAFSKLEYQTNARTTWRLHGLSTSNRLDFAETEEGSLESFGTSYDNLYGWGVHSRIVNDSWLLRTQLSSSRIARDRRGIENDDTSGFDLIDLRQLTTLGLNHQADYRRGRHFWEWGLDARTLEVDYDYLNQRSSADSLALIRQLPPTGITSFDRRFRGQQLSLYLSDRLEVGPRTSFEVGLRFDENSITNDHHLSPRLHFTYALSSRSLLRGAWGQYNQSQRVYELPVQDGQTEFARAERSQQRVIGYERVFGGAEAKKPVTLRIEAYERDIENPRERYENLFEPISIVPELEADRIRVAAETSRARGIEIFLGGALGPRLDGFATYTYARSTDRIDGRNVPRPYDQPHALGLDLAWRGPWQWQLQAAWRYHSGWPTTAIHVERVAQGDGSAIPLPMLGALYGQRMSDYQRLDVRAQRRWDLSRGQLTLYLDVQNATNSTNVRGFDIDIESRGEGFVVLAEENTWGGRIPSLGITWTF